MSYPKIIGFTGKMYSGKTTLGNEMTKLGYTKISFASPLKNIVGYLYDLSDEQLYGNLKEVVDPRYGVTPRYLLQYIGTDLFRNWDPDFWVKIFTRKYGDGGLYVLDDVRFDNESTTIKNMGGIIIKVVSHRNFSEINSEGVQTHVSEQGVKNYDYKIYNDGSISDLRAALHELLQYVERNKSNNNENNETDQ